MSDSVFLVIYITLFFHSIRIAKLKPILYIAQISGFLILCTMFLNYLVPLSSEFQDIQIFLYIIFGVTYMLLLNTQLIANRYPLIESKWKGMPPHYSKEELTSFSTTEKIVNLRKQDGE